MSILNTNTFVNELINAGQDAHQNLYYLKFISNVIDDDDHTRMMKIRADDISIPTATQNTESINYMTVSMDHPVASFSFDKQISISFRVDQNYDIYRDLLTLQAQTSIPNFGYAHDDVDDRWLQIELYALKKPLQKSLGDRQLDPSSLSETDGYEAMYKFKYCWIESITGLNFSYANSGSQKVTVAINFWDYEDMHKAVGIK